MFNRRHKKSVYTHHAETSFPHCHPSAGKNKVLYIFVKKNYESTQQIFFPNDLNRCVRRLYHWLPLVQCHRVDRQARSRASNRRSIAHLCIPLVWLAGRMRPSAFSHAQRRAQEEAFFSNKRTKTESDAENGGRHRRVVRFRKVDRHAHAWAICANCT